MTLAAGVAAVTVLGFVLRARDGRVIATTASGDLVDPVVIGADGLAEHATLVQFSTEMCARCPGTRRLLRTIAAEQLDDVAHVDVDVTHRADLAARFRVMQTPMTLIVDGNGRIRARIAGTPTREAVTAHLAAMRKDHHVSSQRN